MRGKGKRCRGCADLEPWTVAEMVKRTWVIVKIIITKNPILLLTRMEVLAMMSLEIGAEAVEPAGGLCRARGVVQVVV